MGYPNSHVAELGARGVQTDGIGTEDGDGVGGENISMLSGALSTQTFAGVQVRVLGTFEIPLIVLSDVCKVLDISNTHQAASRLREGTVCTTYTTDVMGRRREVCVITEAGLYELLASSRKTVAGPFKAWLFDEVLPSVRKTGQYAVSQAPQFPIPQTRAEALRLAADLSEQNEQLQLENAQMAPKALYFEQLLDVKGNISVGEAAKALKMEMGPNQLFAWMRRNRWMYYPPGKNHNVAYQDKINRGYLYPVESFYIHGDGSKRISTTYLVTHKGLVRLHVEVPVSRLAEKQRNEQTRNK